jgi:integrase
MPHLVESFKFPKRTYLPKTVPSKEELRRFFEALDEDRDRAFFLLAATSGLRRSELLNLSLDDLDLENRTVIPRHAHENGSTKNSWVSCFNNEALSYLQRYLDNRPTDNDKRLWIVGETAFRKAFNRANKKTGLHITPQVLRFWVANEMSRLGMSDRFIDALQGRTPRSILARHYSDFSVERLKEAYDKANLTVLT